MVFVNLYGNTYIPWQWYYYLKWICCCLNISSYTKKEISKMKNNLHIRCMLIKIYHRILAVRNPLLHNIVVCKRTKNKSITCLQPRYTISVLVLIKNFLSLIILENSIKNLALSFRLTQCITRLVNKNFTFKTH